MKKLFTIDDFIIAFISALVYGLSFEIPMLLGWGIWTALPLCLIIGGAIDAVTKRIVFNKTVQKSATNKALVFFALFVIFIIVQYVALQLRGYPLRIIWWEIIFLRFCLLFWDLYLVWYLVGIKSEKFAFVTVTAAKDFYTTICTRGRRLKNLTSRIGKFKADMIPNWL